MTSSTKNRFYTSTLSSACALFILTACGGGGGGDLSSESQTGTVAGTVNAVQADAKSNREKDAGKKDQSGTLNTPASTGSDGTTARTESTSSTPTGSASGTPSAAVGPYGQNAADYVLTFSDEFENGFNTKLWNDHTWDTQSNPTINYAVENGSLKIWPQRDANGNFFNRVIDTDGKFYQTYGFFEIEAKLPVGKGTWPAFWLYNHDDPGNFRPEIDIMEAYAGGGPASGWSDANFHPTAFAATIWTGAPGAQGGHKMLQNLGDLSATYHKYAVKWEPNKQTYYFDGKEIYSVNVTMPRRMYVLLDLLYGSASGQPDHTTPTGKSNSFDVKYVRVWQFK